MLKLAVSIPVIWCIEDRVRNKIPQSCSVRSQTIDPWYPAVRGHGSERFQSGTEKVAGNANVRIMHTERRTANTSRQFFNRKIRHEIVQYNVVERLIQPPLAEAICQERKGDKIVPEAVRLTKHGTHIRSYSCKN